MIRKPLRLAAALAVAATALVPVLGAAGARPVARTVHLRGTAYEFNNVHVSLKGATVRVAEFPALKATVAADGRYDLTVPDHATITPYIVDPGYHTIYLQTFTTNGEDLVNVNFQTPTDTVYRALVALLHVPIDAQGNLVACAIVSTFNTRNVRDLSFAQFIGYGAHGVAGATATTTPTLPTPVYFNKDVLPDPTQTASSIDGGIVWTNVPTGVYTITAHDPATRFASFVATCRPGRVVNANPPWGLYQFGLANPAQLTAGWSVSGAVTQVVALRARRLPAHAVVRVSCTGRGCPFGVRTFRPPAAGFDIRRALGAVRLTAGGVFEVTVSAHAFNGLVVRWVAARGHAPRAATLCVPLGFATPQRSCPTG